MRRACDNSARPWARQCTMRRGGRARRTRVAVAADGRWLTARLAAAAGEGLLRSGCRVVDTGASTVASLAMLIHRHRLDGGLLVGNSSGGPQIVSLKCWGPQGSPWSVGGGLDHVTALLATAPERGSRRSGGLERIDVAAEYRQQLAELFHGLRPLRLVLDTSSAPLLEQLRQLASSSACQIIPPRPPAVGKLAASVQRKFKSVRPAAGGQSSAQAPAADYRAQRAQRLREQVPEDGADFGLWIDGDGDTLELIDQLGQPVNTERLLLALAARLSSDARSIGVVLEADASHAAGRQLLSAGARTFESPSSRESMFGAMQRTGAALGGGPSGRLWFGEESPRSDALRSLAEVLQLLSQGDAALSDVLR